MKLGSSEQEIKGHEQKEIKDSSFLQQGGRGDYKSKIKKRSKRTIVELRKEKSIMTKRSQVTHTKRKAWGCIVNKDADVQP